MSLINFDAHFGEYAEKWMRSNRSKYESVDKMELAMPDVYMRWLNTPADFLGGEAPGMYFSRYDDPEELFELLREYDLQNVPVPDQLMERLSDLGEKSAACLMREAADQDNPESLRVTALNLIKEIDLGDKPMELCLAIVDGRSEKDEPADVAAELLTDMGQRCVARILARFEDVTDEARETYLDILCNYPGLPDVFEKALEAFWNHPEKRALYASYLAKLGDERAIAPLTRALSQSDINYLDYIELRNAVEALGGEVTDKREFSGDPYYETLKNM